MPGREYSLAELQAALDAKRTALSQAEHAAEWSGSLRSFVHAAWPVVEPATAFVSNWHIDAVCDHLEAASRREIRRLVINMPPRHMMNRSGFHADQTCSIPGAVQPAHMGG